MENTEAYFTDIYIRFFREKLDERAKEEVRQVLEIYRNLRGKEPATIVDAGAGWGRHLRVLLEMGYNAYGVEKNPIMAGLFHSELPRWADRLAVSSWGRWNPPAPADLIISLFSSIGWGEEEALFEAAVRWLRPGGVLLVDTDNRDGYVTRPPGRSWQRVSGGYCLDSHRIDWKTSTLKTTRRIVAGGKTYTLRRTLRLFSLHELAKMAEANGLKIVGVWSDLRMSPFHIGSPRMVVAFTSTTADTHTGPVSDHKINT
jgi:SAM-dependent methyltransferase